MAFEAKRALQVYMEHLSQHCWCAGWLIGLEYDLWDWVERRRAGLEWPREGRGFGPPKEWEIDADTLIWLAGHAGGWWRWPEQGPGPVFVGVEEWRQRYEASKRSRETEPPGRTA